MVENEGVRNYYENKDRFYVAVDCIIFGFHEDELKLLLIRRRFDPCIGELSLMGGFLNKGESIDAAAERVLQELTGLENVFMEQIGIFGEVDRDPGERVLSAAYYALINSDDYNKELADSHNAVWVPMNDIPALIFDHNIMVMMAWKQLKRKAAVEPIGFNLLPQYFTLPQLQSLYEAILGETLDKRNFRKKVLAMDIFEKTEEKDKSNSKRGAFYYRFDYDKYNALVQNGSHFAL
ncbi:NUDIX hydrolase [Microbacter margulisiae]|uniref:ADP-ribose pyrophosphatase YjhB (NUDIX family) n=1 Tax=Microbacter margulisiae TaxID=1350067 RepID=A0A7W5H1T3_9PORP|nr:NUDIX domain-containing protein [Microbacter margulisiae]MBB3187938.1 ADP-ribose pyrophosphatase YjhB (NUDIX family) [Microbacter margulisiae]